MHIETHLNSSSNVNKCVLPFFLLLSLPSSKLFPFFGIYSNDTIQSKKKTEKTTSPQQPYKLDAIRRNGAQTQTTTGLVKMCNVHAVGTLKATRKPDPMESGSGDAGCCSGGGDAFFYVDVFHVRV